MMAIANVVADPGGVVNIEVDPQVAGGSLAGFGEPAHCPLTARIPTSTGCVHDLLHGRRPLAPGLG